MDFLANPTGPHTSSLALSVTRMERPLPGCTGTAVQEGGAHRLPSCPPRPAPGRAGEAASFQAVVHPAASESPGGACKAQTTLSLSSDQNGRAGEAGRLVAVLSQQAHAPVARRGGAPQAPGAVLKLKWPEKPVPA